MPDWGLSRVLSHEADGKVKNFFVDAGESKVMEADDECLEIIGSDKSERLVSR